MGEKSVILAFGGNSGDVVDTFRHALEIMQTDGIVSIKKISSLYVSQSLLKDEQADYLNFVCTASTNFKPYRLLRYLKSIEKTCGREAAGRWQARMIDIDIIDYDRMIMKLAGLTLPHKEAWNRSFVLLPMCEIAPDYIDPKSKKSIQYFCKNLHDTLNIKKEVDGIWF